MIYFVSIIHALTCIFIVIFILLQDPKGGVLGSLGGGSSKSFFGSEGASPFLVNVTKWLAIFFACTSFYLSYISSQKDSSLMAQPDNAQTEALKDIQKGEPSPDATQTQNPSDNIQDQAPSDTKAKQTPFENIKTEQTSPETK